MNKYEYLKNTPLTQAVEMYKKALKSAGTTYNTETIETKNALNRVTAKAIYAKRCSPHYCASAMDGVALMSEKTFGASESSPVTIDKDSFIPIDTGDPLPENTDCVVMTENVIEAENGGIMLYSAAVPWQNVRKIGEDISMGDMIAPSFTTVTASLIGAFLAGGVYSFKAVTIPKIAIIPTGDEIVQGEKETLKDGDVPEFNSAIFSAMLSEWGADSKVYETVKDELDLIKKAVVKASKECDAIIVIAGSSAGRDDYTAKALEDTGSLILHGVAIKPGKPAVLGNIGKVPFIGVPGYPVSGIIVMEEIFKCILPLLTKKAYEKPFEIRAKLARQTVSSLKYKDYVRCRIGFIDNEALAVPMGGAAGVVTRFAKASGMFTIPQDSEGKRRGESVSVRLFKPLSELENSVLVVGSHDPLIDEIDDILKRYGSKTVVSSSHAGSMGGIMAIRNCEAHLGGIHLLDTKSGEYNKSYVKTYFPNGGAVLIKGVGRTQGLMVERGNPKGIKTLSDIAEKRVSYVNRQRGSGTRVLLDFLLNEQSILSADIYGYEREEYTHTAVAAAVAAGSACAGLGILSAAKIYDLDFIELYSEQYDFLVSEAAFSDERVKEFLDALNSNEFKSRLKGMGGYTFEDLGQIIEIG
ncbi:MAG TPA: molybdopterin biosynthesis protein [Oscillospiraceae bacterium]|nr:molybdopterin biosynthesis protein [Oscillospiraceae bacterium]